MLGPRALDRALLARQSLLERRSMTPIEAIEHLVGLQAQAPLAPYVGLWSRLVDFDPADLSNAIVERQAVRTSLMRATIHLVSARDALYLWPLVQPVLERGFRSSAFGREVRGVDLTEILAAGRALLAERPRTSPQLASLLVERWPEITADSLVLCDRLSRPARPCPATGCLGHHRARRSDDHGGMARTSARA